MLAPGGGPTTDGSMEAAQDETAAKRGNKWWKLSCKKS
jgi:hypothetical protein